MNVSNLTITLYISFVIYLIAYFSVEFSTACTKMCLHKISKGRDELQRNIDINWQFDKYDDCDYINVDDGLDVPDKDLSILQLNIRGLSSKINDLNHLINHIQIKGQPDIILLCETWLNKNSPPPSQ